MSESSVPENVSYSDSHEWIQVESDIATIGITDFAQSELGDIVFVELPEVGEYAKKGETFGTVEAVKTVEDLIAPLSGEVLEANETLEEDAEQINKDPYGAGWMIKIRIEDEEQLEELLSPSEYSDIINE
ncbi:MAG: glycine cleavage system protein GcvH [Candidatus Latescibacterota bacterium]